MAYGVTMTLNFTTAFSSDTFNLFQHETAETTGSFAAIVFGGPSSQHSGIWSYVGGTSGLWKTGALSGTTVTMEFRQRVDESGVGYGQLVIVPEPLTLGLLGIGSGVAVLGLRRLRRRSRSSDAT